jgi:hypothetical protein
MILSNIEMYKMNEILKIPNLQIITKKELNGKKYDKKNYNYIINLDDNIGSHWVGLYKNIYFDSYGILPPESVENYLNDKYVYSDLQLQPMNNNSNYCGWFVMFFLYYMNNVKYLKSIDIYKKFNIFLKFFNNNKIHLNKKIIFDFFIDIYKYEQNK